MAGFTLSANDVQKIRWMHRVLKTLSGEGITRGLAGIRVRGIPQAQGLKPIFQQPQLFMIFANAARPGHYQIGTLGPVATPGNADISSGSSLAITDFGAAPDAFNAYGRNLWEMGQTGHSLVDHTNTSFVPSVFMGIPVDTAPDGKIVYAFLGFQKETCSTGS